MAFRNLVVGPQACEATMLCLDREDGSSISERPLKWEDGEVENVTLILNTTQMALLMKELAELLADAAMEDYEAE